MGQDRNMLILNNVVNYTEQLKGLSLLLLSYSMTLLL